MLLPRTLPAAYRVSGWLCATGWQVGVVTLPFMAGTVIQGLIVLNNPDYEFKSWHGTMLVIAVTSLALIFTTLFASKLPTIETFLLYAHIAGFTAFVIVIWVMAPKGNTYEVLFVFKNSGGWDSNGLAAMIGVIAPLNAVNGYDCAVHMCECLFLVPFHTFEVTGLAKVQRKRSTMRAQQYPKS